MLAFVHGRGSRYAARMKYTSAAIVAAGSAVLVSSSAAVALAKSELRFGPKDVRSVAYVAKSENKNQVHYAVALDDRCMPAGPKPVFGYWQNRERGLPPVEPLLDREQRAYGIASQSVSGNRVTIKLRALPDRAIVFETGPDGEACSARALAPIEGKMARLDNVYVKLGFPFRVKYLLVQGTGLDDGQPLRERVKK